MELIRIGAEEKTNFTKVGDESCVGPALIMCVNGGPKPVVSRYLKHAHARYRAQMDGLSE
jgi:hypothetical protein